MTFGQSDLARVDIPWRPLQALYVNNSTKVDPLIVPSALGEGGWPIWVMSLSYWIVGVAALIGFLQGMRVRRKALFRASFLFASMAMMFLRGVTTMFHFGHWRMFWLYLCTLFGPIYLQYWMFSLLVLFVWRTHFVVTNQEPIIPLWLYPLYHTFQVILLGLAVFFSYFLADEWTIRDTKDWDRKPALFVAVLYAILSISGALSLSRLYRMRLLLATVLLNDQSRVSQETAKHAHGARRHRQNTAERNASTQDTEPDILADDDISCNSRSTSRSTDRSLTFVGDHSDAGVAAGRAATAVEYSQDHLVSDHLWAVDASPSQSRKRGSTASAVTSASYSEPVGVSRPKYAQLAVLIATFLVLFGLRAIWNILYYARANPLQRLISDFIERKERRDVEVANLLFYLIFEILPTALVVNGFTFNLCAGRRGAGRRAPMSTQRDLSTPLMYGPSPPSPMSLHGDSPVQDAAAVRSGPVASSSGSFV